MKREILFFTGLLFALAASGQRVAENTYWFYFTDKANNGYSIDQPEAFLSRRAIDRRAWQSWPIDENDLPVTRNYVDSLAALGAEIRHTSKWLNGVLLTSSDSLLTDTLMRLSFVDTVRWKPSPAILHYPKIPAGERFPAPLTTPPGYRYGYAEDQVKQLDLDFLHEKGYTGKGLLIAVLDAGFAALPTLPAFTEPFNGGQIVAQRNFVDRNQDVYNSHSHGTHVSSIIIGNWPDSLMGTAPDAQVVLALTENVQSETRIEEFAWIEAAEWADSLGADIINTSLGYTTFDDPSTNYSYMDMDGKTAHSSFANSMTATRGMISVTSAGNSGNDPWYHIGAPGDATDILTVGAVDASGIVAPFSSRGPTYDRRIKPDVSAMGVRTAVQSTTGEISLGAGTSYASPMIAGATAVLWQAFPTLSSTTLMQWILESGDHADTPDVAYGYGIPSFKRACRAITPVKSSPAFSRLKIYPNPFNDHFMVEIPGEVSTPCTVVVYNLQGKIIHRETFNTTTRQITLPDDPPGMYVVETESDGESYRNLIIKQQ